MAFNPQGLDAMGVLGWIVLSSLLAFLAVNAFTLFVSSRLRSSLGVVAISAAVALIPTIIRMFMAGGSFGHGFAAAEGNLLNWLRLCLPSGGVSLTGAMMDELTGLRFLWIGDFVTWSPYVMLTARGRADTYMVRPDRARLPPPRQLTGCTLNLGAVFSPCWRGRFRFVDSGEGRRYNFDVKFAQFGRDGREWN
ncbi:MAG: hypothetical protein ACLTSG_01105 [Lachnospiraceae bacterium]